MRNLDLLYRYIYAEPTATTNSLTISTAEGNIKSFLFSMNSIDQFTVLLTTSIPPSDMPTSSAPTSNYPQSWQLDSIWSTSPLMSMLVRLCILQSTEISASTLMTLSREMLDPHLLFSAYHHLVSKRELPPNQPRVCLLRHKTGAPSLSLKDLNSPLGQVIVVSTGLVLEKL